MAFDANGNPETTVNSAGLSTLSGIASEIQTVAGLSSEITTVNSNASNINSVAGSIANVNQVASNLSSVSNFANIYLGAASSKSNSRSRWIALDDGDLYFNTTSNNLRVYSSSSGWQSAGSVTNGTSARFTFTITGTPTTVSGTDDAGNSLTYDANFIDVYLNGTKMVNGTDVTVTSGNSLVFASALTNGDVVDCVAFGTFQVANIDAGTAITSGTLPVSRGGTGKTTSDLSGQAGKVLVVNTAQMF